MPRKTRLDPAKAFRLARHLERHILASCPHAARAMRRVVAELAVDAFQANQAAASLDTETLALAVLIETQGAASNADVARRVGCTVKTLERSDKFRRCRDMMQLQRDKYREVRDK